MFGYFLIIFIGARIDLLSYAVREDPITSGSLLPMGMITSHSEERDSVEHDLVSHFLHDLPLLNNDSAKVCYCLEDTPQGNQHTVSIK